MSPLTATLRRVTASDMGALRGQTEVNIRARAGRRKQEARQCGERLNVTTVGSRDVPGYSQRTVSRGVSAIW